MYKIIDLQGGSLKSTELHDTLESVRESLISFHEIDFVETSELPLSALKNMTIDDLCEWGMWDVQKDGLSIFCQLPN